MSGSQVSSIGAWMALKPASLSCCVSGAWIGWMKAGTRTLNSSALPSFAQNPSAPLA